MVRTVLIFIFIVWSINVNTNHTLVECDRIKTGNKKKIMFHPHAKKNINDNFFRSFLHSKKVNLDVTMSYVKLLQNGMMNEVNMTVIYCL